MLLCFGFPCSLPFHASATEFRISFCQMTWLIAVMNEERTIDTKTTDNWIKYAEIMRLIPSPSSQQVCMQQFFSPITSLGGSLFHPSWGQEPFCMAEAADHLELLAANSVEPNPPLEVTRSNLHAALIMYHRDHNVSLWFHWCVELVHSIQCRCLPAPGPAVGPGRPGLIPREAINFQPVSCQVTFVLIDVL